MAEAMKKFKSGILIFELDKMLNFSFKASVHRDQKRSA